MNVISVLTVFGELLGRVDALPDNDVSSFKITKPLVLVPLMTERGPDITFRRPMITSASMSSLELKPSHVVFVEPNPPKQLVDEYLRITSGILMA